MPTINEGQEGSCEPWNALCRRRAEPKFYLLPIDSAFLGVHRMTQRLSAILMMFLTEWRG